MKVNKKIAIQLLGMAVILGACLLSPVSMIAQGPPDSNTEIFTDPDLPIDGGIGFLIAAGIGYGIKKVRDERKKNRTT